MPMCLNCLGEFEEKNKRRQKYCSAYCRLSFWKKIHPEKVKEHSQKGWKTFQERHPRFCKRCNGDVLKGKLYCNECLNQKRSEDLKRFRIERRLKVFGLLGGAKCKYCGCNEFEILEINHINGGGCRDYRRGAGGTLENDILQGRKKAEDFEVACRVCNAWHYAVRKMGNDGWNITWRMKKQ